MLVSLHSRGLSRGDSSTSVKSALASNQDDSDDTELPLRLRCEEVWMSGAPVYFSVSSFGTANPYTWADDFSSEDVGVISSDETVDRSK